MYYHPLKSDCDRVKALPFVCPFIPFIGLITPPVLPFVGNKLPLVGIKGFTLVELIITLTVAGILLAIAAPNFGTFLSQNRLATQINDFTADLNVARSEAVKRNSGAGVCTSNTGTSCVAGNWDGGWLVFVDDDNSGGWTAGNTIISTHEKLSGTNTLIGTTPVIFYARSGIMTSGQGTYTLCDSRYRKTRIITIVATGRASISEGTC